MKMRFSVVLLASLAACSASTEPQGQLTTATVGGKSYDVFYDPFGGDRAVIFGKRSVIVSALPKAEIIAQGTPCEFDTGSSSVYEKSEMIHPTRPDLENFGWVPITCSGT